MQLPEKIRSILPTDKVLEIGPGAMPHPRADMFLEKRFENEELAFQQRGYELAKDYSRKIIYYDNLPFPFKDKEFDYVICSHVIEHIPSEDLEFFIKELQRIAHKGYIEFPTIFYELINYQPVHLWLMNLRDDTILFLNKNHFTTNYVHKVYRELFYTEDKYLNKSFQKFKELFFAGFEWRDNINYKIVESYDELINESDFERYKRYIKISGISTPQLSMFDKLANKYKIFKKKFKININNRISTTAILEEKSLIKIAKTAEIKEGVIIRTYRNKVYVGENTQINPYTVIYGGSGVYIGNNVLIAPHCTIAAGNHDYKQTTVPMRFANNISQGPIVIEDDVWIGANVTISDGVTIKKGAVVAANSFVNKDVNEYDIVGGIPAKVLGNRKDFK